MSESTPRRPERLRRPAAARVDGDPPSRRPAARRLPHAVPRLRARLSPTCASTSTTTTSATSTGTSPRGCRRPTCASTTRTARSPRGSCSTLSPSVDFGSQQLRKRAVSAEFVAVLARLLTRHGNRVGALFYGDRVDTVIPARSGRRHVLHLLHRMLDAAAAGRRPRRPTCAICCRPRTASRRGARSCSSSPISSARPAGRSRSRISRSATRSSRCASTIRSRWTCPTSACSSCRTPRPASSSSSTRTTAAFASASRPPRAAREASCARRSGAAGVDALELVDRRRPGRRDPALRRSAQAAQPARDRRRPAGASGRHRTRAPQPPKR